MGDETVTEENAWFVPITVRPVEEIRVTDVQVFLNRDQAAMVGAAIRYYLDHVETGKKIYLILDAMRRDINAAFTSPQTRS